MSELLIFDCWRCGQKDVQCLYCVNSILIDPDTKLPLSMGWDDNGNQITVEPTPEARARARKDPICDMCVTNELGPELSAAKRHEDGCVGP